jgi:hypothetical protein
MWNTGINASYKILYMGGLGNQLFQVARAIDLSDRSIGVQLIYIGEKLDWLYRLGGHTKHDNSLDLGDFYGIATAKIVFVSNSSYAFWVALCGNNVHNSTVYLLNSWRFADFLPTLHTSTVCSSIKKLDT